MRSHLSYSRRGLPRSIPIPSKRPPPAASIRIYLLHPITWISDVLVEILLVERDEDDFEHFSVRHALRLKPESLYVGGPRFGKRLRVAECQRHFQIVAIQPMPTFSQA